jgi:hypothetical protein
MVERCTVSSLSQRVERSRESCDTRETLKARYRRAKAKFELGHFGSAAEEAQSINTNEGRALLKSALEETRKRRPTYELIIDSYRFANGRRAQM